MMVLCWNLTVLLLFLTPETFLQSVVAPRPSLLFAHAVTTPPPVRHPKILFVTSAGGEDDYDDDDDDSDGHTPHPMVPSPTKPSLLREAQPCMYNPCLENQEPCAHVSAQTGCFCPGLSGADQPPRPPRLQELVTVANGKVEVRWCAPFSMVSGYRVVIEGGNGTALELGEAFRHGYVGPLKAGSKVCVEAVNKAGSSAPSEASCLRYDPHETSSYALKAGLIGGGASVILLLALTAVILWRRQACRKAARGSVEGLGNSAYSTEGIM